MLLRWDKIIKSIPKLSINRGIKDVNQLYQMLGYESSNKSISQSIAKYTFKWGNNEIFENQSKDFEFTIKPKMSFQGSVYSGNIMKKHIQINLN